jgi:hypothetical protein
LRPNNYNQLFFILARFIIIIILLSKKNKNIIIRASPKQVNEETIYG